MRRLVPLTILFCGLWGCAQILGAHELPEGTGGSGGASATTTSATTSTSSTSGDASAPDDASTGDADTNPCVGVSAGHIAIVMAAVSNAPPGKPGIAGYYLCPMGAASCTSSSYQDPIPGCVGQSGKPALCDLGMLPSGTKIYFIGGYHKNSNSPTDTYSSTISAGQVMTLGSFYACQGPTTVGSFMEGTSFNVPSDFEGAMGPSDETPATANLLYTVP
jgi:hypothetical protein